jgi:hypothetical protein
LHRDAHLAHLERPVVGEKGHVRRIAAIGQHDASAARLRLRGVEGVPAPAHESLEPGVHVHRVEPVQVAHHQARRNAQRAAHADGHVREVAAHARAVLQGVQRVGRAVAHAVLVDEVPVDPVANGLDLRVAGLCVAGDAAREVFHLVAGAVAALQQVLQRVERQVFHRYGGGVGRDGDGGLGLHDHLDLDAHLAARNLQPLAQVAEAVDVFGGRHPRVQLVAFADHPLGVAAARAQHGDHGAVGGGVHGHLAGGMESHGEILWVTLGETAGRAVRALRKHSAAGESREHCAAHLRARVAAA